MRKNWLTDYSSNPCTVALHNMLTHFSFLVSYVLHVVHLHAGWLCKAHPIYISGKLYKASIQIKLAIGMQILVFFRPKESLKLLAS